jgi:uncharacterized glyoxalase superfamily protein PhnB
MPYKPAGYTSVAPYLIVPDADATLAFVREVFGSEPLYLHRDPEGRLRHAEVRIDDTVVMCGSAEGAAPAHVHVYLSDVDAAFARALAAGGSEVQPVADQPDGDRRGGVADPTGTTWWLSTELKPRTQATPPPAKN